MDEIDRYLKREFNKKVEVPESFERTIRQALYSERFEQVCKRRKLIKKISILCLILLCTTGCAIGGYIAYENVWKEPRQYTYAELKNTIEQSNVTEKEKANLISEEEAKEKTLEIVNNLGYKNQEITNIELNQNKEDGYEEVYYSMESKNNYNENLKISLDAVTGELNFLEDERNMTNSDNKISIEQATNISNEIYNDAGLTKEYKMNSCQEEMRAYKGQNIEMWVSKYNKIYDNLINPYEEIEILFTIHNNKPKIASIIKSENGMYEDNEEVITENEAIEIAKNKEKELTDNDISKIDSTIGIRKFNKYIYDLENNIAIDNEKIDSDDKMIAETENRVRKVWIISIYHEEFETENIESYLKSKDKSYYIDVTTGEIVGGSKV